MRYDALTIPHDPRRYMQTENKTSLQAIHILKSYLDSLNVPYKSSDKINELFVKKFQQEEEVKIQVSDNNINLIDNEGIKIKSHDVISPDIDKVLGTVYLITDHTGYKKINPLNRGDAPKQRINYHDDYELVYLRHALLRRTPSPNDTKRLHSYLPIIKRSAQKILYKFKSVLVPMGFDIQDLTNLGLVHTLCFIHNYAFNENEIDNVKLLTEYLNQRFGEFAKVTYKKAINSTCLSQVTKIPFGSDEDGELDKYLNFVPDERNVMADEEYCNGKFTVFNEDNSTSLLEIISDKFLSFTPYLNGKQITKEEAREVYLKSRKIVEIEENSNIIGPTINHKRLQAKQDLYDKLDAMSHESREALLSYAALSRDYNVDARSVARKLCDELYCSTCKVKISIGIHCSKCGAQGIPRYGVDYLKFKKEAEGQSIFDSLTAAVSPYEKLRLTDKIKATVPIMSKMEIDLLAKKMAKECFDNLPSILSCPGCKTDKSKTEFGIRVPRRKSDGMPLKACRQSYCNPCRKPKR